MNKFRMRRIGVASNVGPTRPTLSDCIELLLAQADPMAGEVLDALQSQLGRSNVPGSDRGLHDPDPELRAVMDRLKTEAPAFRSAFAAELRQQVYQSGSQEAARSPVGRLEDIRVFDVFELESHIEQSLARQEVQRAVEDAMPLFDALISALLGWTSVQPTLNPLKPDAFARALRETLDKWVQPEDLRPLLLRPAAIALGIGMHELFREACEWMLSQGVDPVAATDRGGRPRGFETARAQTELERTMETLEKLRRLLDGEKPGDGRSGILRDFTHTLPASFVALQDMRMVEPMIKRLRERPPLANGAVAEDVPAHAHHSPAARAQARNRRIGRQLGEQVVRFMLDQLVLDERLLLPVRNQMRLLEPLLVRLAQEDPRFFIDRGHPARQFLDRVAQRSLPYGREDEEGVTGFVACMTSAVRALEQGAGDAAAFGQVLEQLEEDWNAFEAMRRRLREEVQNARLRAEQRMALAHRLSAAVVERLRGTAVPEQVAAFLRGPWSQVMAEVHLRGEEGSLDPKPYASVMEDLAWSVQPALVWRDYPRLVRMIPRLLGRINEGLVLIRYPQEPISDFLDRLSAMHEQIMDERRRAVAAAREAGLSQPAPLEAGPSEASESGLDEAQDADEAPEPEPISESVRADLESVIHTPPEEDEGSEAGARTSRLPRFAPMPDFIPESVRDLPLGAWVDLEKAGGAWVRAQLTWISHNRNLFMFVSGSGMSHAMSRRTMERLDTQGRLRIAAGAPAVDLVLDDAVAAAGPRIPTLADQQPGI